MSVNNKRSSRMASNPKTPASSSVHEEEQATDDEEGLPATSTTEGLAMRLLNPKVHAAEAEEYASYVDQYRNLNLSNELQYQHSAADMELYEKAVQVAKGSAILPNLLQVDPADGDIYERCISSMRPQEALGA